VLVLRSFLPYGDFVVSILVGASVDVVPMARNDFLAFPSFSSLHSLSAHIFARVSSVLIKIETAINVPLGLNLVKTCPGTVHMHGSLYQVGTTNLR
jgi:hypothetical protein